jgi:hypothetical protein
MSMVADRVQVSWDADKRKWVVRVEVGLEVIRRYCNLPRDADEASLRTAAEKTVVDEGYQVSADKISVAR